MKARRLLLTGRVQGVGFRPFVYRLALEYQLTGWVKNLGGEVAIHIQGQPAQLDDFSRDLIATAPPLSQPQIQANQDTPCEAVDSFIILASAAQTSAHIHVPPDYFTCPDCLAELRDPSDRRYQYPFINCTQCGPRYTLIVSLPYDRPATTMANFPLCPDCAAEYHNPLNRRFHAQPLACPVCGPQLEFNSQQADLAKLTALDAAVTALQQGKILAVKGIGGYHLMCDASRADSIQRLRQLKPRPHKPLAVMLPDMDDSLSRYGIELSPAQQAFLASPLRPIVLLPWQPGSLPESLAPGLGELGVMLPYSPLHHILLEQVGKPLVATSANLSGEPVLTDNAEVEQRLATVADAFLHHNRPIARPADDPVFRWIAAKPRPLRIGRGCAPLELALPFRLPQPLLAVGGHLKNTLALAWESRLIVSPHIGELDSQRSLQVFEQLIDNLQQLYQIRAAKVLCDAHPGYASTRWAMNSGLPVTKIWHHHAHASAVAGEFHDVSQWLMFSWDGVGLGADGTLWGGDALYGKPGHWQRLARWRPFHLPGGDKAGREPWRSAAALCWEAGIAWDLPPQVDANLLHHAWQRRLNCPQTHAVGRIFDAAAAILGICQQASFEGQGPMWLEAMAAHYCAANPNIGTAAEYTASVSRNADGDWESDWQGVLKRLFANQANVARAAAVFHLDIAAALVAQVQAIAATHRVDAIGLSGGVFQNRLLTEMVMRDLQALGFTVYLSATIPLNDAGLSAGQVFEFAGQLGL